MSTKPTSPDLSEFYRLAQPKKPPCQVAFVADQLPKEDAAALLAACDTDKGIINAGAIEKWLKLRGHDVSQQRIVNHRLGKCTCDA